VAGVAFLFIRRLRAAGHAAPPQSAPTL
jgi:hypothetical protein